MSLHKYTKKFSFQESKGSFTLDAGIGIHRWIASTQRAADLALHRRHQLSDRKYYIIQQHATIHCVKSVQSDRALAKANVKFYKFVAFWIVNFTFPNWFTFIFLPKNFSQPFGTIWPTLRPASRSPQPRCRAWRKRTACRVPSPTCPGINTIKLSFCPLHTSWCDN